MFELVPNAPLRRIIAIYYLSVISWLKFLIMSFLLKQSAKIMKLLKKNGLAKEQLLIVTSNIKKAGT